MNDLAKPDAILVRHLTERLDPFDPAVVCRFGSRALGTARPDSDLDVAFLPMNASDAWAVYQAAEDLAALLGVEVDLLDLCRGSTVMRKEVVRTGYRIACRRPADADQFEMYTLSD